MYVKFSSGKGNLTEKEVLKDRGEKKRIETKGKYTIK